jgi:hypothetical protein
MPNNIFGSDYSGGEFVLHIPNKISQMQTGDPQKINKKYSK